MWGGTQSTSAHVECPTDDWPGGWQPSCRVPLWYPHCPCEAWGQEVVVTTWAAQGCSKWEWQRSLSLTFTQMRPDGCPVMQINNGRPLCFGGSPV